MNEWLTNPVKEIDTSLYDIAIQHQLQLTKPAGSLGILEDIAVKFVTWQGTISPIIHSPIIAIFAADHGIAEEQVSAYPQSVTTEMLKNFSVGGGAINVIAESLNIPLHVMDLGTVVDPGVLDKVINKRIGPGTKNFMTQKAMTAEQCSQALKAGAEFVMQAKNKSVDLFIGGEMGISNTTSATAIASILLNKAVKDLVGTGTGLDETAVQHKTTIIENAINFHRQEINNNNEPDCLLVLETFGGFEIVALVGAYLACAQYGIPILVDGFICSVAALVTIKIAADAKQWMCFTHLSAEQGHQLLLDYLDVEPILKLRMRLGEASGAALALATIKIAINLHNNMATFEQADVSGHD